MRWKTKTDPPESVSGGEDSPPTRRSSRVGSGRFFGWIRLPDQSGQPYTKLIYILFFYIKENQLSFYIRFFNLFVGFDAMENAFHVKVGVSCTTVNSCKNNIILTMYHFNKYKKDCKNYYIPSHSFQNMNCIANRLFIIFFYIILYIVRYTNT